MGSGTSKEGSREGVSMLKSCSGFCQPSCAQDQSFLTALCLPFSEDTLPALSASPNAIQLFRDHWHIFSFSYMQESLLSGRLPPSRWQAFLADAPNSSGAPQPSQLLSQAALIPLEEMVACGATQMPCSVLVVFILHL